MNGSIASAIFLAFVVFGTSPVRADSDPNPGASETLGKTYSVVKAQFANAKREIESLALVIAELEKDPGVERLPGTLASLKKLLSDLDRANAARKETLNQIRRDFSH